MLSRVSRPRPRQGVDLVNLPLWHRLRERVRRWYEGEFVPRPERRSGESFGFILPGHYERSWSARALSAIVEFHRQHKKDVLLLLYAAFIGAVITALIA